MRKPIVEDYCQMFVISKKKSIKLWERNPSASPGIEKP
jgi:hypothetical protein